MTAPTPPTPSPRRIAVIAVHGVADQKPGESSAAIASLLGDVGLPPGPDGPHYTAFTATEIEIPLLPVKVRPAPEKEAEFERARRTLSPARDAFQERRQYLTRARHREVKSVVPTLEGKGPVELEGTLAHEFMRMQLEEYTGGPESPTYRTRRLEGQRVAAEPGNPADIDADARRTPSSGPGALDDPTGEQPPTEPPTTGNVGQRLVHIYEVHWADLSRLGTGVLAFFGGVYQLLLHLGTLGRQAVDDAMSEALDDARLRRAWPFRLVSFLHIAAVRFLTLPVPILNVILLGGSLAALPAARLSESAAAWFTMAGAAAIGAAIVYAVERRFVPRNPFVWAILPLAGAVFAALLARLILRHVSTHHALGVVWWLGNGLLLWWVVRAYEPFRKGATLVGLLAYVLCFGLFLQSAELARENGWLAGQRLEVATLWTTQQIFLLLQVSWAGVFTFAIFAFLAGIAILPLIGGAAERARARAALRTGRLALSLSAGAFLFVTIVIWTGLFAYGRDKLHVFECIRPSVVPIDGVRTLIDAPASIARWVPPADASPEEAAARAKRCQEARMEEKGALVTAAAAPQQAALDSVVAAPSGDAAIARFGSRVPAAGEQTTQDYFRGLLVLSVSSGAPVSLALTGIALLLLLWMALPSIRAETEGRLASTNRESASMGRWLSRGLDATALVTLLFWLSVFLVPTGFTWIDRARRAGWVSPLEAFFTTLTDATSLLLTQTGALVAGSAVVIVGAIIKFGGTAVDVMLDVDNYLRTTPAYATPRARITERYVSLLRYVASDEPPGGRYDAIVIIAHSLGALITVDLLRFLERERRNGGDPTLARIGFGPLGGPEAAAATGNEIPLHLFTMGAPIRQLLNRFFPHRYGWVRPIPDNGDGPLPDRSPPIPPWRPLLPDPTPVHVVRWENAYRSGDYVGRSLWLEEWYNRNDGGADAGAFPEPASLYWGRSATSGEVLIGEMCIGLGGHTHYWDRSAPDIRNRLDYLIATA